MRPVNEKLAADLLEAGKQEFLEKISNVIVKGDTILVKASNGMKFTEIVDKTIKENNSDKNFKINYGKNYFPRKEYKNVIYEEGEYESVVITIGDGNGKNFWCVLFPPLCMLDEDSNIEYSSLVKEIIDKYF